MYKFLKPKPFTILTSALLLLITVPTHAACKHEGQVTTCTFSAAEKPKADEIVSKVYTYCRAEIGAESVCQKYKNYDQAYRYYDENFCTVDPDGTECLALFEKVYSYCRETEGDEKSCFKYRDDFTYAKDYYDANKCSIDSDLPDCKAKPTLKK